MKKDRVALLSFGTVTKWIIEWNHFLFVDLFLYLCIPYNLLQMITNDSMFFSIHFWQFVFICIHYYSRGANPIEHVFFVAHWNQDNPWMAVFSTLIKTYGVNSTGDDNNWAPYVVPLWLFAMHPSAVLHATQFNRLINFGNWLDDTIVHHINYSRFLPCSGGKRIQTFSWKLQW